MPMHSIKHRSTSTTLFGSSLIVLSSLFYGSYGVWTRLMGNNFGPYMQAWIRAVLVIAILLPFSLWGKQKWQPIRWHEDKWWLIFWVLGNSIIGAGQYYAINHIGIGLALLTLYTGYLISMFMLGWIFNGERYSLDKFVATLLAMVGLTLAFTPSFSHATLMPFTTAFAAGLCIGIDMVVSQKVTYSSSQTTILAWATGLVGTVPLAFLLHQQVPSYHNYTQWLYLLLFVGVCVAASWLSIHGVKLIEAGAAGILGLLEVVWGILFGALFFHEHPTIVVFLGAACIISAAAVPYVKEYKRGEPKIIEEMPL